MRSKVANHVWPFRSFCRLLPLILSLTTSLCLPDGASAQCELARLQSGDGEPSFGSSVAYDANRLVIDGNTGMVNGVSAGDMPVVGPSIEPCQLDTVLQPNEPHSFGDAVAMDGDLAVITDGGSELAPGRAFSLRRSGVNWTITGELTPPGGSGPYYGYGMHANSTDLRGNRAIVSGHLFQWSGMSWLYVGYLGGTSDINSMSSIDGDVAVVRDDLTLLVFRRYSGLWAQQAQLQLDGQPLRALDPKQA